MPSSANYKRDGRAGRSIPKNTSCICKECNISFIGTKKNKFCSESCKGKHKYTNKKVTTESQYKYISGNWSKYFTRLIHSKPERASLTLESLLNLIEQQEYKCALTGVPLTCDLQVGLISKTNASIDRLDAGGPYILGNIQLVCRAVNSFRGNLSIEEFTWWCNQVVNKAKGDTTHA